MRSQLQTYPPHSNSKLHVTLMTDQLKLLSLWQHSSYRWKTWGSSSSTTHDPSPPTLSSGLPLPCIFCTWVWSESASSVHLGEFKSRANGEQSFQQSILLACICVHLISVLINPYHYRNSKIWWGLPGPPCPLYSTICIYRKYAENYCIQLSQSSSTLFSQTLL